MAFLAVGLILLASLAPVVRLLLSNFAQKTCERIHGDAAGVMS